MFLYFFLCFCSVLFLFLFLNYMFSPRLFKFFHLQSKQHIYKPKQTEQLEGKQQKNKQNRNLPARPLEIFIFRGGSWAGNALFRFFLVFL